jgi:hypothetical protein
MAYEDNALYMLIRERAGSKMLREAEQVNAYNRAQDLFSEGTQHDLEMAGREINRFHQLYPPLEKEFPMDFITLSEVARINLKELEQLPWIYVDMLRVLTCRDTVAAELVDKMLKESPAAAWRPNHAVGIEAKDAFNHVYTGWHQANETFIRETRNWVEADDHERKSSAWSSPIMRAVLAPFMLRTMKLE